MKLFATTSIALLFSVAVLSSNAQAHLQADALLASPAKAVQRSAPNTTKKATAYSAQDLAKMLEQQMLAGSAVSMKFKIKGGDQVTVTADINSKKVRIESNSMTIVSDGATVWNYQKKNNQVTIDAIGKSSALQNPRDIFLFASNYAASLVSSKGNSYVLALTPNQKVQSILQSAGGVSKLTFTLGIAKDKLTIRSASAESKGQNFETGGLTVKSLKSVKASEFAFAAPKGAKVIDLRE
jgi:outer membrane lipoprotein-sorting protein